MSSQTAAPGPITWTWNTPPNRVLLDVDDVPGATSYKWYLNGVLKATTTSSNYQLPMSGNVSCGNFYYFGVRAVSVCGTSAESYIGADMPPCGFSFKVSPNPSTDYVKIETNNEINATLSDKKTIEVQEIEIYDKTGIVKIRQKFGSGQTTANVSVAALPSDFYTLRIFDGQVWQSCKIIIQR
ncbi:MAG: T9SS type A sorting domain-containing protein [Chitinophagaceae bacterium]|nr:T9SS type A sorting domain-containing protein [Chitinophagaceae bacterium]